MIIKCECGKRLKVPETSTGRIKCGSCGAILNVTPPKAEKKKTAAESAPKPTIRETTKLKRKKKSPSEKKSSSVLKKPSISSPAPGRKKSTSERSKKRASTRVKDVPKQTPSPGFGAFVRFFFQNSADILRLTWVRFLRHRCHLKRLTTVSHGVVESTDSAGEVLSEKEVEYCSKIAGSKGFLRARLYRAMLAGLEPENVRVAEEKVLRSRESVLEPARRELVEECTCRIDALSKREDDLRAQRSRVPVFFHSLFMVIWGLILAVFLTVLYISGSYIQAIKHQDENIRAGEYIVRATELIRQRNFKGAMEEYRKLDNDLIYTDFQQYIDSLEKIAKKGIREETERQERLKTEKARLDKARNTILDLCEKASELLKQHKFVSANQHLASCPEEYLNTVYGREISEKQAEIRQRAGEFFAAAALQVGIHEGKGEFAAALGVYRNIPSLGIKKLDAYVKERIIGLKQAVEDEKKEAVFLQRAESAWKKVQTAAVQRLKTKEFFAAIASLKTFPDEFNHTVYGAKRLALRTEIHQQCMAWYFDVKQQIDSMVAQKKYQDAVKMLRQVERSALAGMDMYAKASAKKYAAVAARIEKTRKQASAVSGAFSRMKKNAQRYMRDKDYREAYNQIQTFEKEYKGNIKNEISDSLDSLKNMLCLWASNDYYFIQSRLELMNKSGNTPVPKPPVKKKLKAYSFTFNDPAQIVSWQAESGKWKLEAGKLAQSDFMPSTIILKKIHILPEPVTVKFDAIFKEKDCEISLLIGEPGKQPVWSMIFGKGKVSVVSSGILNSRKQESSLNQKYSLTVECGKKNSRLLINGKQVIKEEFSLFTNKVRISLKTLGGAAEFDNIGIRGSLLKTER